ncbi:MAG: type II secretion system protein [Candidatus Nanopelagicales bacterium]
MGRPLLVRLRRRLTGDAGFSLIEAVVALSILALVSTSFSYGMNLALRVTRDDRLREQATHLAERELEIVRNTFQHSDQNGQLGAITAGRVVNAAPLPGGTVGSPLLIDGRKFTVERTSSLLLNGEGQSACDGGGTVDYLTIAVNVRVTWSDTGQDHTVQSNTLLTPIKGVEGDVGYLAAKLTDAQGNGTENVAVVASGPGGSVTRYTAGDGCAVFMLSNSGTYTLTLNTAGYVNSEGFSTVAKSAALEKGKLKVMPFAYGRAATLGVSYTTAPGHQLPTPLPGLTLFNSGLPPPGERHTTPGESSPVTISDLWPFPDGYSLWAGTCDQSDPALNGLGYPRPVSRTVTPGSTTPAAVVLSPVAVRTIAHGSLPSAIPVTGVTLTATSASSTGCDPAGVTLTLGTTGADGWLRSSLPAGEWLVTPDNPTVTCLEVDPISACPQQTGTLVVVDAAGAAPSPLSVVTLPDMAVALP